jgi:hypothetical protein
MIILRSAMRRHKQDAVIYILCVYVRLICVGLDWIGLDWIELDWIVLADAGGSEKTGIDIRDVMYVRAVGCIGQWLCVLCHVAVLNKRILCC